MARSLIEIQNSILAQKDAYPELAVLNNSSPTSIWRLWVYIVSYAVWLHETFWDVHKKEVSEIAARAIPGTPPWYRYQCLQYQDGYLLTWNEESLKYEYTAIDEDAKIVKYASIREQQGIVGVKVAKAAAGIPEPLSVPELASFSAYMNKIKFAGTFLNIVSEAADKLKVYADIHYNATLPEATIQSQVEAAINAYIRELPFDGRFQIIRLVDKIQSVEGVEDVEMGTVSAAFGVNPYVDISLDYFPYAGYLEIDGTFPLSSTLNFVPRV